MEIQKSFMNEGQEGTLFVVGTPIGNLNDFSPRAREILEQVDIIAAEDTRHTRKLLSAFGIRGSLVSYHEHNKQSREPELIQKLMDGKSIALVSDAGMPASLTSAMLLPSISFWMSSGSLDCLLCSW